MRERFGRLRAVRRQSAQATCAREFTARGLGNGNVAVGRHLPRVRTRVSDRRPRIRARGINECTAFHVNEHDALAGTGATKRFKSSSVLLEQNTQQVSCRVNEGFKSSSVLLEQFSGDDCSLSKAWF